MLQELQLEITDKLATENLVVNHLSRLENRESGNSFSDYFLDKTLYVVTDRLPWYADIINSIVAKIFFKDLSRAQKGR